MADTMEEGMMGEQLTTEQAVKLLAPIGSVEVVDISIAATTNDVYRIETREHGVFFVKFHTARWYADQPDTFFVVEREVATCELLRKRGMSLPYPAWGDYARTVVSRSVYICGELPGMPLPEALDRFPAEHGAILRAFGSYMRQLHSIEFARPGILAAAHAAVAPAQGAIPSVDSWDAHPMHRPELLQSGAMEMVEANASLLPADVVGLLRKKFETLADLVRPDYSPPRFTVGNCHAWHFHLEKGNEGWRTLGFYDFEAVSAGDSTIDLIELETTLTPALKSTAWREPFFEGYGARPGIEGYKLRLLTYVLPKLGNSSSELIPDPDWFVERLRQLVKATAWEELEWYPR